MYYCICNTMDSFVIAMHVNISMLFANLPISYGLKIYGLNTLQESPKNSLKLYSI